MTIRSYTPSHAAEWDAFVAQAKNGTFLFHRLYMDYHAHRYADSSLMFYDDGGKLAALLPAHLRTQATFAGEDTTDGKAPTLVSHGGLTYGGLIMAPHFSPMLAMESFHELNQWCRMQGIGSVEYKPVPHIYHRLHAEDDLYAIHHVCKARLIGRDAGTDIIRHRAPRWERVRRRGVKRATEARITVRRSDDYAAFWRILSSNLHTRYGVQPVHTLDEIELLHGRFPKNIKLYCAYHTEQIVGGLVLYITPTVVHAQYSAATAEGKKLGAMDAIYHHVLSNEYKDVPHFDFGRSTEGPAGDVLNPRLIFQKQGYGGTTVCYDTYRWSVL